jgi:hypothetical protein
MPDSRFTTIGEALSPYSTCVDSRAHSHVSGKVAIRSLQLLVLQFTDGYIGAQRYTNMEQTFPQMLNEKQTARLLACSVAALRKWRRAGGGPIFAKFQRCVRYDARALEHFLAEHSSGYEKAAECGPSAPARLPEKRGK